jgi:hypothetical protein
MKTSTTDRWRYRRTPNAKYHHEEDVGWYALAAAIVKQAVDDYRFADAYLKGENKVKSTSWAARYASNAEHTKDEVVKFLKGQWYGTLCDIDPKLILKKLGVRE